MTDRDSAPGQDWTRFDDADVIFVCQDGYRLPSARVRCFNFAAILNEQGMRAEVLSFYDHLGAPDQGGPLSHIPEPDKIRLNLLAWEVLSRNSRAILVVQKLGYHTLSVMLAAARNGNRVVLDYDDYELDAPPFRRLEPWIPSLRPQELFTTVAGRASGCIVSSHRLHDLLMPVNPHTHLVHTVPDLRVFNDARRGEPRRRFGDTVNILYSGEIWGDIPMKDIVFSLDAFALMPRRVRDQACFHIIGFGGAWEELKRRVRERYPDLGNIRFHEFIAPDGFGAVLNEMDIGVLPYSDNEFNRAKSPTKMFEYLVTRVAVCGCPVGEVAHCIEHGVTGMLATELADFSAHLARLVDDRTVRHAIAGEALRQGLARYTLQGVGARLAAILREVAQRPDSRTSGATAEEFLTRALGRRLPVAPRELHIARNDLRALAAAGDPDGEDPRRWSAPLIALLDWPGLAAAEGIDGERAGTLRSAARRLRWSARLRPELRIDTPARPEGPPVLSKLAAAEDWEDSGWWSWATRFRTNIATFHRDQIAGVEDRDRLLDEDTRSNVYNYYKRSHGAWERVQMLYALDRLGALGTDRGVLVTGGHEDGFYLLLSELVTRVDVLDIGPQAAAHAARVAAGDLDPWLVKPRRYHRDRLTLHHGAPSPQVFAGRRWDAAAVIQSVLPCQNMAGLLGWIDARLRPGGVLTFSTQVILNGGTDVRGLPTRLAAPDGLPRLLGRHTGLTVEGPFDASLSDATLDRFVTTGAPDARNPFFVARTGDTLHATAVWTCRKTTDTDPGGWTALERAIGESRAEEPG